MGRPVWCVVVLWAVLSPGCQDQGPDQTGGSGGQGQTALAPANSGSPAATDGAVTRRVRTNTQLTHGDVRIAAGNFRPSTYRDEQDVEKTGLTAALWVYVRDKKEQNRTIRVHPGQRFEAGQFSFEVTRVEQDWVELVIRKR